MVFVATTNNPVTGTNVLKTWMLMLSNGSGDTFNYVLTGIPANANGLSAKTAWNLRSKVGVTLDGNGQATLVNFTGTKFLRGGDLTGDSLVNTLDNLVLKAHFSANYPAADINGDGLVNTLDNLMLRQWFGKTGDPQ